jgi:shikimate dehydrogenase
LKIVITERFILSLPSFRLRYVLLHEQRFLGINVTVPHKVAILDCLSSMDESAAKMGAVNTLVWHEDGYKGYNTDGYGLLQSLNEDLKVNLATTSVLIVGAGGAAQTAAAVCLQAGCPELWITNRSQERLDDVVQFLKKKLSCPVQITSHFCTYANITRDIT